MFDQLIPFKSISWDFDQTLIDHELSEKFWEFIEENPFDQVHHIVTLRSHGMQHRIFDDLFKRGSCLRRAHFGEIVNVPDELYTHHIMMAGIELLENGSVVLGKIDTASNYCLFKGKQCHRLGSQVLIDDMEDNNISLAGCKRYGIIHIHPDELLPDDTV